jgi:hypothetical protein
MAIKKSVYISGPRMGTSNYQGYTIEDLKKLSKKRKKKK